MRIKAKAGFIAAGDFSIRGRRGLIRESFSGLSRRSAYAVSKRLKYTRGRAEKSAFGKTAPRRASGANRKIRRANPGVSAKNGRSAAPTIAALLFCAFLIGGCWDARELNGRAFVTAVGLDKSGGNMLVSLSMAAVGSEEEAGASGEGGGTGEALALAGASVSRSVYLGQAKVIVIGGAIAADEAALTEAVIYFERRENVCPGAVVVFADSAEEALKPRESGRGAADFVTDFYKRGGGGVKRVTLERFSRALRLEGVCDAPKLYVNESGFSLSSK
jgi:hypothetical protein